MNYHEKIDHFIHSLTFDEFKTYINILMNQEDKTSLNKIEDSFIDHFQEDINTLLLFVNDIDKVKYLVEELNFNIYVISRSHSTAIFGKNPDVTEYYYHKGLSINNPDSDDYTPLCEASLDTTAKLLDLGVTVDQRLFMYTDKNTPDKFKLILEQNYPVSIRSEEWQSVFTLSQSFNEILTTDFDLWRKFKEKNPYNIDNNAKSKILYGYIEYSFSQSKTLNIEECFKLLDIKDAYNKQDVIDKFISNIPFNLSPELNVDKTFTLLNLDIHSYKIDGKPWFFHHTVNKTLLDLLNLYNIDRLQKDNNGEMWFYNLKDTYNILPDLSVICGNDFNKLKEVNHQSQNFLFSLSSQQIFQLLNYTFLPPDKPSCCKEEFLSFLKTEIIFPALSNDFFNMDSVNHNVSEYTLFALRNEFSQWEKEKIKQHMSGKGGSVHKNMTRI